MRIYAVRIHSPASKKFIKAAYYYQVTKKWKGKGDYRYRSMEKILTWHGEVVV